MSSFTVGLDLGQGQDYSALVVVERVLVLPAGVTVGDFYRRPGAFSGLAEQLHVRHLRRWELGTPYPSIVADVVTMMRAPQMDDALLLIDGTGVGRAVRDIFRDAWTLQSFGVYLPVAVTVTGGYQRHGWSVPKSDLMAAIQVPLQQGRLKIAPRLALGDVLERELVGFRQKISVTGRDTYDIPRRDGEGHGDLATALSLALFQPNTYRRPNVVENAEHKRRASE
jgi:hypothetical protein